MTDLPLRLILLPLDERPVNTRYPEAVALMAGAQLLLPPLAIRGWKRKPADLELLDRWLIDVAPTCTAALISCDYLGSGNLINARISDATATEVIARLTIVTKLGIPVHAFSLITRVSNADDNIEEPLYWNEWGTKFYKYSALAHRQLSDALEPDDQAGFSMLDGRLPIGPKSDWLTRRLRNHTVNLALLELAARGKLASLLLTSDDTAAWGLPSRERRWLSEWSSLIPQLNQKVEMHPGADEVGTALVAKLINQSRGITPSVWIDYAIEADKSLIAPYEDRPIAETISGQVNACGGTVAESRSSADLILGVLTPSPNRKDYQLGYLDDDRRFRSGPYRALFERLAEAQEREIPVILADVAYPNGADPLAMELLFTPDCDLQPGDLAGYGAWNTAGNTLGVAIAHGMISRLSHGFEDRAFVHKMFLAHRFLEDWGYQTIVRREARHFANTKWTRLDPDPDDEDEQAQLCAFIERRMSEILLQLQQQGVGNGFRVKPNSTRLPWKRTFEVDFDLETA